MIDLTISGYFYPFSSNPFFTFLYDYGEYPSQAIALFSLCLYLFRKRELHYLYLFLNLAIGAFLINEIGLKNNWGRPRPRQVIEFGGNLPYRPFYKPNFSKQQEATKSFPCGHCTAGFYFFAFAFLGKRFNRKSMIYFGWITGLTFGSLLGLARIAQGGHFFTDVLFGALVMYLTAYLLDICIYERFNPKTATNR